MTDEVKAWSGWLHRAARRRAVGRLPEGLRARYDEEWESAIEETPGEILKLIFSVGLLRAAVKIRRAALQRSAGPEARLLALKRAFDVVFSAEVLALLAPLLLAIAIVIKLDSPGSIFYTTDRVGKKGVVFRCIKFRTMACDPVSRRVEFTHPGEPGSLFFKVSNEPRLTRIGRFLRRFSYDELPQFINVLRGEMSVVGPRPPLVGEMAKRNPDDLRRLDVTPGVTGLWQVQRREDPLSSEDKSLDVAYIDNWSIWLDFKILLRTVFAVISRADSNPDRDAEDSRGRDD